MSPLLHNPRFASAFAGLADIALHPGRHAADDAQTHSRWVAQRAVELAQANGRSEAERQLLENLGLAHDIGKVTGTARPEASVALLREAGVEDEALLALVKVHDTNLPWFLAHQRGQAPSASAWRRLAGKVDLTLLCLFMVADRVDCPGGWRANPPLCWFLAEAQRQGLLGSPLALDPPGQRHERSAGAVLVRGGEILLVRTRPQAFEIPKGRLTWDETPAQAAARELAEETGLRSPVEIGDELGRSIYTFESDADTVHKTVHYLLARPASGEVSLGALPDGVRERRWVGHSELQTLPLVDDSVRALLTRALA